MFIIDLIVSFIRQPREAWRELTRPDPPIPDDYYFQQRRREAAKAAAERLSASWHGRQSARQDRRK